MNQHLQNILDAIQQSEHLSAEEKTALSKAAKNADKDLEITAFKLERTEKIKNTTAILLEETIAELEQKRKAIEDQNHELEIESSLERVRSVAMGMKKREDMLDICKTISQQLELLKVKEIRNVQTAIFYDEKGIYMNYEFYAKHDKLLITETEFRNHPVAEKFANQMMKGPNEVFIHGFTGKEVKDWLEYQKGTNVFIDSYLEKASSLTYYWYSLGPVAMGISTYEPLKEEEIELFKRFRNVFELAYRRYIDIEKAEAQAREAQIQLALERVRARTMAMQQSEELSEAVYILFQQFRELGENPDQATIGVINEKEHVIEYWVTMYGNQMNKVFKFSIDEPHVTNKIYNAWKEGKKSLVIDLSGKDLLEFMTYRAGKGGAAVNPNEKRRIINVAFFSKGLLIVQSTEEHSEESIKLLERFAAVFEQTYTRFLDLQKAETQARESEIELALERVRARTMAMQKSEELKEVINVVYDQLVHLNILVEHAGFIIDYKERDDLHLWIADQHLAPSEVTIPFFDCPPNNSIKEAKEKGQDFFKYLLTFEEKNKFYRDLFKFVPGVPEETLEYYFNCPGLAGSGVLLENIGLYIENFSGNPYSVEDNAVLMRFGKVFQQTYTRFLDLQKAEAQSRESQIQLALERVRARTMAMQKSDELQDVVHTLLERLKDLNVEFYTSIIILFAGDSKDIVWWLENKEKQQYSRILVPYADIAYLRDLFDARENGSSHFSKTYSFEKKNELFHHLFSATEFQYVPEKQRKFLLESKAATMSVAMAKNTGIHLTRYTDKAFSEEDNAILKRFVKVFEQTYTRFLDLQKAEAQSREAQIEASLERVRASAMGMHKSSDLLAVINLLADQFQTLGFKIHTANFNTSYKEKDWDLWLYFPGERMLPDKIRVPYINHPYFNRTLESVARGDDFSSFVFTKEEKDGFLDHIYANTPLKNISEERKKFTYNAPGFAWSAAHLKNTVITIANYDAEPYTEEQNTIIRRFGKVFEQAYTRFLDLQKAEAQAREAQIEAALEKVRSRTLAMQKSDELAETAAVLFKQLVHLGIEPNRLYIGIIKDDNGHIEFWATDEEGDKVSTQFIGDASRNASMKKMYDAWKAERKSLTIDMQGKELSDYFQYMVDELKVPFTKGLSQKRRMQNIAIFGKGFLGIASPDEQPESTTHLLERFAAVFNLTYTRFNDLQIAEAHALKAEQDIIEIKAARKKAEDTLTELQATQKQLIQSEKMASLGELTAGIAHEIQNPLNFVNNFSDVSNELLEEMKTELDKGEIEEAKVIADDVKQNLEKILHHGKRADAIVKGMLQHSRSSSGQKELIDINALADEYLRLAYHGLRAKDKSFNAKFETDFDDSIGKINIVPQEIGRVILNLINNAFYAVTEKKKQVGDGYDPAVIVTTKKLGEKVEIRVIDNGNGIPQRVLDKIFQPFFTTKPTGQGTGLGLSLSYDVITKGHGGELKVQTKEGQGSEFIIQLPNQISL